ncbi:MAG: MucR family transcriptional regulator [Magnetococcales bacterium]|nr:MucR family transcriptional regulator [Magnetococcales bacterium]
MSLLKFTAEIVKSYVSRNEIPPEEIPELLVSVHHSLQSLSDISPLPSSLSQEVEEAEEGILHVVEEEGEMPLEPAVPISEAITEDAVICLICGKSNKAIRGHLSRTHGMDVKEYRERFGLPSDFLMVAPSYSARRRKLAIEAGLGEKLQAGRKRSRKSK